MSLLWDGRFEKPASSELWKFSASKTDRRLLVHDVTGSIAHVQMLAHVKILNDAESKKIQQGLEQILTEARSQSFAFAETDEDVHSAVERRLNEIIGDLAGKLHTGRSRNDQVALDTKLYLREAALQRISQIQLLMTTLVKRADQHQDQVVPAFTHLQQAQPISFGHQLLSYAWMLKRDLERFQDFYRRADSSPLGAGAVGGSSLSLDAAYASQTLGFAKAFDNSIDAVSSRDFVSEFCFCVAQSMVNLSRLSEDIILWNTKEFGWATLPDDLATGSSMLPQKKNPDIAELARGKTAITIGHLVSILTLQKALPLSYNRDLQEDKEIVFQSDDTLKATLSALNALMAHIEFHPKAPDSSTLAIDLAEQLVQRGVPFRQAHKAVGKIFALLSKTNRDLHELTTTELQEAHESFTSEDLDLLKPVTSIKRRATQGGSSITSVQTQIQNLKTFLEGDQK